MNFIASSIWVCYI